MGLLRLLLALSVVGAHSKLIPREFSGVGGEAAVEAFFMISGLYMGLILTKSYKQRTKAFFLNRFLRIFPEFWIVGFVTLVTYSMLDGPRIIQGITSLPDFLSDLLTLANTFIFGSDLVMFLQVNNGLVTFGPFLESTPPLFTLLLIPQAWTLSLELGFYLLSPLLVRIRSAWLLSFILVSFISKYLICGIILKLQDPWNYRFFPFELTFFLIGILISRKIINRPQDFKVRFPAQFYWSVIVIIFFFAPLLLGQNLTKSSWISHYFAQFTLVICIGLIIEPLFWLSRKSRFDEKLGTYSYPLYLVHILSIFLFTKMIAIEQFTIFNTNSNLQTLLFVLFLFVTSWPLVQVGKIVELLRTRIRGKSYSK